LAALRRSGLAVPQPAEWSSDLGTALWGALFPRAERVVVAPADDRPLLLQAACLAGTLQAPLVVARGAPGEAASLACRLQRWGTQHVYLTGSTKLTQRSPNLPVTRLADGPAVTD